MKSLRFQSVFDIIGPVMIGPSSSHTAGAVRIGKIVSSIFDDTPTEVEFQLFNSFAKTYRGHGTDLALVAGILGMDTDDPEIPNSLEIAHKRGIKIVWTIQKDSNAPHPNTTKITVKNAHKTISVTGISIGGGNIQVTELNGFAVSLNMNTPTIIIVHQDIPGMIALVTEALSRYDINIAQMNVTREKAGEKAIMIIEVDSRNCDEAIEGSMFYSIKELVEQAELDFQGNVAELMITTEFELTGREREEVLLLMERNLEVMKASVQLGLNENKSRSGLTGGDAAKLDHYIKNGKTLSDYTILSAARNAIAVNEHNAKMGLVCATPTAGSAGCLPSVLTAAIEKLDLSHEQQLDFLFAAGAFGLVIANNASISGAEGGCQAEVGSASAMSAAALTLAAGGTPYQASQAIAFVIKNMLGLICDPVAGLVEVPCVKRNAMGASFAFIAADMALAGIESKIPVDEVIDAMYQVGSSMPTAFRETAEGGLAATPTGRRLQKEIFGE